MYLFIFSAFFAYYGLDKLQNALGLTDLPWDHYIPEIVYIMEFVLAAVFGLAILTMFGWNLWSVGQGQTAVEVHDNDHYREIAKARGEEFVNSYDLGFKKNLALFFNIGEGRYPWYTLVFPFRIPPYTDGHHWARQKGHGSHGCIGVVEQLTDTDDD